jgi:hypothetical protein
MPIIDDSNPVLAVRVVPPYKERWDRIGRLYHKPGFVLPDDYMSVPVYRDLIKQGSLVPSITNVIDVLSSQYLIDWGAKLVAVEAIRLALKFENELKHRPAAAEKYLKNIPHERKTFAGTRGTKVHKACELLSLEKSIAHLPLTEDEQACVNHFRRWLEIFQPTFNFTEITGFGKTRTTNLGFAGTADFHVTIKGVNMLGDTKCTTDDTLVLLRDGSQKQAKDIKIGDEVVSWFESTGLRVDRVVNAASNGMKPTYSIFTELGQVLTVTGNHKFLKRSSQGMTWEEADTLDKDDTVYVVSGWSHSPSKIDTAYPFNKHLSPYLLGLLWALGQYNNTPWTDSGKVSFPSTARAELFDELASFGFLKSADDRIRVKTGLRRVAHKTDYNEDETRAFDIPDLLELINTSLIPDFVFTSSLIFQTAFMSGVQEVFANKAVNEEFFFVEHRSTESLKSLQQLYFNNGQITKIGMNPKTGHPVLRLPFQSGDQVHIYGLEEVKVTRVRQNPEPVHTIALEVENTHNHVTGGILTHNTNMSGLHPSVALQLAANRNVDEVTPDSVNLLTPPSTDVTMGLHLSPTGFKFQEIESGERIYEVFEALREAWDFHAFEGADLTPKGVFGRTYKTLADV